MRTYIITIIFLLPTYLFAQNDSMPKDSLKAMRLLLQDVTIKATRADKNVPTTHTEVGGDELQKTNLAQDMPILLDQTPSVVTTSDAGMGVGYTGMRIRGSDQSRINVTLNGIPYNDPESQGVFWVDIPDIASSVDNIQIQRGVGTSTNGAGAFGGTVNVQTSRIEAKPYGIISGSYGSFNTWKTMGGFGTGLINDKFGFEGRISKVHSDGYVDRAKSDLFSYFLTGGFFGKKDVVRINVFSGNEHTYQSWYGVDAVTLDTNRTYNFAGTDKPGSPYSNQTDNYRQDHYQLLYTHQFNHLFTGNVALHYTRGYGYYEEYKAAQSFADYGLDNVVLGGDTVTTTDLIRQLWLNNHFYGTVFSFAYDNSNNLNITLGGGWNQFINDSYGEIIWAQYASNSQYPQRYYDGGSHKNDFNIYAKASYRPIKKLNIFLDMQYRNVNQVIGGIDGNLLPLSVAENLNFFNPKAGLSYDLNAKNSLYASFAIGNREPTRSDFTDAKPGYVPKAENLKNLEVGYHFSTEKYALSANYYLMYYKDQLVLTGELNDVGASIRTNVPKSYRTGIELQAQLKPVKQLVIDLNATWSHNKIKDFGEVLYVYDADYNYLDTQVNHYKNTDISFSPAWIVGGTITVLPVKGLEMALVTKYVGKQYLDNTGSEDRKLNGYIVNNLRLSYSLKKWFMKEINFTVMVNNLFNVKYESNGYSYSELYDDGTGQTSRGDYNYYYPQAGINVLGGITLKF